ncbi:MAG: RnfABCDGE type electron transport complex subunit D [Firmicutes bacterium]|nr:RnfABCDGE type electron transport complex subunit D [Bacillota bacterium]
MTESEKMLRNPPHIKNPDTVNGMMADVALALFPVFVWGIYSFGARALAVICVTVIAAVLTEVLFSLAVNKKIVVHDASSAITGLILSLILPVSIPLYSAALGAVFAVLVVKCLFGGLGHNFLNPALAGYAFLKLSFPDAMNVYPEGLSGVSVDPLTELSLGETPTESLFDLLVGRCGGSIGTVSALLIFAGFVYLLIRGTVTWHIPVIYISVFILLSVVLTDDASPFVYAASEVLSGTLIFVAVFMATDPVTSPSSPFGKILYAAVAGCVTYAMRVYGGDTDGAAYTILLMNILSPLFDKLTKPKIFGGVRHE